MTFLNIIIAESSNPELIEKNIEHIEQVLGISITIHDVYGKLLLRPGMPLLSKQHTSHRTKFLCGVGFCQKCSYECGITANKRAGDSYKPFIHECWKGLSEIVIPVYLAGIHTATFFAGTWRSRTLHKIKFKGKTADWTARRSALPILSITEAKKKISLLSVFAHGIFRDIRTVTQSESRAPTRKQEIMRFLRLNNPSCSSIDNLAGVLHLSTSRTSHIVQELFGESFGKLLNRERIERAKSLLASTDLPIKEIALRTGVENQYYFSRLFRRETGYSPSGYRRAAPGTCHDHVCS